MKNKLNKSISTVILLASCFLLFVCAHQSYSQDLTSDKDGIKTTKKGNLEIIHDKFTGDITIRVANTSNLSILYDNETNAQKSIIIPAYQGEESDHMNGFNWFDWNKNFFLIILNPTFVDHLTEEMPVYFLIDGERNSETAYYRDDEEQKREYFVIPFFKEDWKQIAESDTTKFRIEKKVFYVDKNTKELMAEILKEYQAIKSKFKETDESKEVKIPKKEKSAPYELNWEGDIERNPMVQPLPDNTTDSEATVTIRFEVKPDGSIGRIVPLKKMNPELEREVTRTLRSWRFSQLPSGVPQQSQWGTITFRFVKE